MSTNNSEVKPEPQNQKGLSSLWNTFHQWAGLNQATLSGAIDIIVIKHPVGSIPQCIEEKKLIDENNDGEATFVCTPFYVRFGKLQLLHISREKHVTVEIKINDKPVDLQMKLGPAGEGYFVIPASKDENVSNDLLASPINAPDINDVNKIQSMPTIKLDPVNDQTEMDVVISSPVSLPINDVDNRNNSISNNDNDVDSGDTSESGLMWWSWDWGVVPSRLNENDLSINKSPRNNDDNNKSYINSIQNDSKDENTLDLALDLIEKKLEESKTNINNDNETSNYSWWAHIFNIFKSKKDNERSESVIEYLSKKDHQMLNERLNEIKSNQEANNIDIKSNINNENDITIDIDRNNANNVSSNTDNIVISQDDSNINLKTKNEDEINEQNRCGSAPPFGSSQNLAELGRKYSDNNIETTYNKNNIARSSEPVLNNPLKINVNINPDILYEGRAKSAMKHSPTASYNSSTYEDYSEIDDEIINTMIPIDIDSNNLQVGSIKMSLCGHKLGNNMNKNQKNFEKFLITFKQLCEDPNIVFNNKLIIKYGKRLYPGAVALPLLMSYLVFGKPLTAKSLTNLATQPNFRHIHQRQSGYDDDLDLSDLDPTYNNTKTNNKKKRTKQDSSSGYSWHFWSKSTKSKKLKKKDNDKNIQDDEGVVMNNDSPIRNQPILLNLPKSNKKTEQQYVKSLRPTSDMLASLPLKKGQNKITFTVKSKLQGLQHVNARIYLWDSDTKIVISDVDGTITKSDVMGHVAPLLTGNNWSHNGVCELFTNIYKNGYKIMYLTSRAIGQAHATRQYLFDNIKKTKKDKINNTNNDNSNINNIAIDIMRKLPEGPIIMAPDSLLKAFTREVVRRKPQEFKIPALNDIKKLFSKEHNPFYSAFGNRATDLISYLTVNVPYQRIFIIEPNGKIHTKNINIDTSYDELNANVDDIFININAMHANENQEFNQFQYWSNIDNININNLPDLSDDE